jgi:hypothetical protein
VSGWNIAALRPKKRSKPYGRFLVAIADRDAAVQAIQEWFPDAKVVVNSTATSESLAAHALRDGKILAFTGMAQSISLTKGRRSAMVRASSRRARRAVALP